MKKLLFLLLLSMPLTPARAHTPPQVACIALTATGATAIARSLSFAVKDPVKKVTVNAVLTVAAGYALLRLSDRLYKPGVGAMQGDMFHGAKDGAVLTVAVAVPLGVFWDMRKVNKKK